MGKRFSNFPITRLQNYKMSFTTADRNNVLRWETETQMKKAGKNIEKARKVVKKIGQELAADPEFKDEILAPLKMQGVEQFGDFAIQVRMKMKTLPNQQFTIRRRAYAMIQKAFAENGIEFAFPTVQIAGGGGTADRGPCGTVHRRGA